MNRRQLANELIRRRIARESLDDFANYMATSQHLDFMYSPVKHQRVITRAIDQLLSPLDDPNHPKDRWGDPVTRLLLTAPPGSASATGFAAPLGLGLGSSDPTNAAVPKRPARARITSANDPLGVRANLYLDEEPLLAPSVLV